MPGPGVRLRETALAVLIVAISLFSLAYRLVVANPEPSDRAADVLEAYVSVVPRLQGAERVGFAPFGAGHVLAGGARFLAQNALAPRLIETDLSQVLLVISLPGAPASLDADPRLAGFELTGVSEEGVRIYRRRAR